MAQLFIGNKEKRVIMPKRKQCDFLLKIINNSGTSWTLLADKLGVSKRTLFDWRRGKYFMPLSSFKKMCRLGKIKFPNSIKTREPFWSARKAAKKGGLAMYKKYGSIGDPLVRKQKWQDWWEKTGKNNLNHYFVTKEITKPEKSKELAEFVGMMLGDGGITSRQVSVYLNSEIDRAYGLFVKKLFSNLFKTKISIYYRKNEKTMRVTVSSTNLVKFCKSLGLKVGDKLKQNLDIPSWIEKDEEFKIACMRGLMDTDGCLFNERHNIKNKIYSYPRLSLVSLSPQLRHSVFVILKNFGFSPFVRGNRSVQLENYLEIKEYFAKIGTNHPKNKEKFLDLFGGVG